VNLEIAGFLAVVGASTAAGNIVAGIYRARVRQLGHLRTALGLLETEITYAASALPAALERVAAGLEGPVADILARAAALVRSGEGLAPGEAWERAVREIYPATALRAEDIDPVLALGSHLGLTDRDDQRRHLRLAAERLEAREKAAREERSSAERMWRYLGLLGGLALAVAFL